MSLSLVGGDASGGLTQLGDSEFFSSAVLLRWEGALSYGAQAPLTGGQLALEEGHALAGKELSIETGRVGFTEDEGVLRFELTEVVEPESGRKVTARLNGCWRSSF